MYDYAKDLTAMIDGLRTADLGADSYELGLRALTMGVAQDRRANVAVAKIASAIKAGVSKADNFVFPASAGMIGTYEVQGLFWSLPGGSVLKDGSEVVARAAKAGSLVPREGQTSLGTLINALQEAGVAQATLTSRVSKASNKEVAFAILTDLLAKKVEEAAEAAVAAEVEAANAEPEAEAEAEAKAATILSLVTASGGALKRAVKGEAKDGAKFETGDLDQLKAELELRATEIATLREKYFPQTAE
jgi:hypothetical protein